MKQSLDCHLCVYRLNVVDKVVSRCFLELDFFKSFFSCVTDIVAGCWLEPVMWPLLFFFKDMVGGTSPTRGSRSHEGLQWATRGLISPWQVGDRSG